MGAETPTEALLRWRERGVVLKLVGHRDWDWDSSRDRRGLDEVLSDERCDKDKEDNTADPHGHPERVQPAGCVVGAGCRGYSALVSDRLLERHCGKAEGVVHRLQAGSSVVEADGGADAGGVRCASSVGAEGTDLTPLAVGHVTPDDARGNQRTLGDDVGRQCD